MTDKYDVAARVYVNRCVAAIRRSDDKNAKRWFDAAWKAKVDYGCTSQTEDDLYWLRGNWYPTKGTGINITEKACYYEGRILASGENDYY